MPARPFRRSVPPGSLPAMDKSRTAALGRYGEDLAAEHLTAAGMTVLARNWRCGRIGEVDVVALDRRLRRLRPMLWTALALSAIVVWLGLRMHR